MNKKYEQQSLVKHGLRITSEYHKFSALQSPHVQHQLKRLGKAVKGLMNELRDRGLRL